MIPAMIPITHRHNSNSGSSVYLKTSQSTKNLCLSGVNFFQTSLLQTYETAAPPGWQINIQKLKAFQLLHWHPMKDHGITTMGHQLFIFLPNIQLQFFAKSQGWKQCQYYTQWWFIIMQGNTQMFSCMHNSLKKQFNTLYWIPYAKRNGFGAWNIMPSTRSPGTQTIMRQLPRSTSGIMTQIGKGGLISAPPIPAGFWGLQRSEIWQKALPKLSLLCCSFLRNWKIAVLGPECSLEWVTGVDNQSRGTGIH